MNSIVSKQIRAATASKLPARGSGNCRIPLVRISRSSHISTSASRLQIRQGRSISTASKSKPKMTDATNDPLSGLWQPTHLQRLHYGSGSVSKHLLDCLPNEKSKAFIITGNSLATKTPLIQSVEKVLGSKHAGTFSKIGQHAPVAQLDEATAMVENDSSVDTVISIGGGSP